AGARQTMPAGCSVWSPALRDSASTMISWRCRRERVTRLKAQQARLAMERHPYRTIVLLDVDCRVLRPLVESPGGLSPPGAPKTVHDPLESHGSRCSAVAMA